MAAENASRGYAVSGQINLLSWTIDRVECVSLAGLSLPVPKEKNKILSILAVRRKATGNIHTGRTC